MYNNIKRLFASFSRDESGASMTEYAIMIAVIAVVAIAAATALGVRVDAAFDALNNLFNP